MVRFFSGLASCFALLAAMFCFSGAALADEGVFQMNFTTAYVERHPVVQNCWLPWAEEVKQRTNGKVIITFFNPNTLCAERETLDATRKGQISIGQHILGMSQGRHPYFSVCDVPSVLSNSIAASEAYWNVYASTPEIQAEFQGIKILAVHSSAPSQFDMAKGEIKTLADFKGKKLLCVSGDNGRTVKALGGSPMVMPATDFYLSLSRNMANGCMLPMAPLRGLKISEALSSITVASMGMNTFWMGMNQELYDSLPAEYKQVIDDTTGLKMSLAIGKALYDGDMADYRNLAKGGIVMNVINPDERAEWLELASEPAKEAWFKTMAQRKYGNAQEIWDRAQKIFAEAEAKYSHLSDYEKNSAK